MVAHTHWDREWYHVAARFRQRLVPLLDLLLATAPDADAPFLLDGQTVTLSDYLLVRPEKREVLSRHLAARSLEAGPWYVLGDNLIPSGEAIVRNLEAGVRTLSSLAASSPAVAYCPDTFGHPAAMPMIAAGFGLKLAVVWRGLGGASHPVEDVMAWASPDGSSILLYHLPRDGYEFGSSLPKSEEGAATRWSQIIETLGDRNRTGVMMLLAGADHHAPQPAIEELLELGRRFASASNARGHRHVAIERGSLVEAAQRIAEAAHRTTDAEQGSKSIPTVTGELRDSYGYTWALQGTFSTRAHQKRGNAILERALLRDVEPWIALTWIHGDLDSRQLSTDARITLAQLPALLSHAWETLLRTHPHDTLCGCCSDQVADAMKVRQQSVSSQILGLKRAALENALHHNDVLARGRSLGIEMGDTNFVSDMSKGVSVVVRNRVSKARSGVAEVSLLETVADVGVGPSSALSRKVRETQELSSRLPVWRVNTGSLAGAEFQMISSRMRHERRESPQHYPDDGHRSREQGLALG